MKARKRTSYSKKIILISVLLILFDLILLWFIKYKTHGMGLSDFSFAYLGNILNLLFAIILTTGLIVSMYIKNKTKDSLVLTYSIIMTVFLIAAVASIYFKIPFQRSYLFEHPLPEVFTGFMFILYQFIQFVFISTIWINIIGGKELVFLNASVNALVIMMLLFFFAFIYLSKNFRNNQVTGSTKNVAVVLGAAVWSKNIPSPSLAARVDKAAKLFKSGKADNIQLTGSNAPGELSEAEVAYRRLKDKNIDTTAIWLEKKSTSTNEQVKFIKQDLISTKKISNIIIVSDSYHLTRVHEICSFYNVNADIEASDLSLSFDNKLYYKIRESIALVIFWFFAL